jgi:GH25 family lysozyme M1 (1,4-beta-N-acetylmuramidase)
MRWTARALLAAAITVTVAVSPVQAAPVAAPPAPDPAARQVEPGQAYLGWDSRPTAAAAADPRSSVVAPAASVVYGNDVSGWQGNVNWASWWNAGFRFAYVKATEGTGYTNTYFTQQYNGSYNQGFIRGSYHFALPNKSSGATQADYFVNHGGGWSRDGETLPGVLDIEFNPYGATCYGLSQASMRSWISSFTSRYKSRTGRDAVINTNTSWWKSSTGNSGAFGSTNPLWVANYATSTPPLPAGWGYYTFHQYTSSPLDKDKFNGSSARLKALALG